MSGFVAANAYGYFAGFQLPRELKDRSLRMAEKVIPIASLAETARNSLEERLRIAELKSGSEVFIRIFKREAELEVWLRDEDQFRRLHTYPICYHSGFLGPKLMEGDNQSPEGFYSVTAKQLNPGSRYYRAFNIGFPNEYDQAHGRTGSALMVHGNCVSIGCYAMTDEGIAEIYQLVSSALRSGQQRVGVHIFPFRMTDQNLRSQPPGPWRKYWDNLREGYDLFEDTQIPPKVSVCAKRYAFGATTGNCKVIAGW